MRVAVLTVSDSVAAGKRQDRSGEVIVDWARSRGWEVTVREVVPDESDLIARALARLADEDRADLILSTGGTGLAPRDVTPEATRAVIEREAPGIAEAIRAAHRESVPRSMLSRGVAGARGSALIVNLPGSPKAVSEALAVLDPVVEHALALLKGAVTDHDADGRGE
jgi:molybdenum cofactor synthesis domain-containing protein